MKDLIKMAWELKNDQEYPNHIEDDNNRYILSQKTKEKGKVILKTFITEIYIECPVCGYHTSLDYSPKLGEIVECWNCNSEFMLGKREVEVEE